MTARALSYGERSLARLLFGDAIDYARVRIHDRGYFWKFQSRHTAVAPNGQIYFNREDFLADFSLAGPKGIHWFMHEMVHVWQWQLGYRLRLRGACRIGLSYPTSWRRASALAISIWRRRATCWPTTSC